MKKYVVYIAYTFALFSTLGSLFFSEILKLPPCILCWYQRIVMYPLVIILTVGILRKDKGIYLYVLPFSILGLFIGFYHNLLYYHILPESISPCIKGISCTSRQIELFGFITIPLLSFLAFAIITVCMIVYKRSMHHK